MVSSLALILLIFGVNNALDCSQFTDYSSCYSTLCSYKQLKCRCASPVNLDILFTISTSSYIGSSNFNNLLKPWLTTITETGINTGSSYVGWNIFSSDSTLTNIQTTSYNQMTDNIANINYNSGVADLANALIATQTAFTNSTSDRQKINIIIMATNPYKQDTTTSEVCGYASSLKQAGIKTIFIGIGQQWKGARIDCLVENTSTDIIHINSWDKKTFNDSLPTIYDILCPIDLNIKITEIKPSKSTGTDVRFIEFFNTGIEIKPTNTLNFNGLITGSVNNISVSQGQYVVLYNTNDGSISCSNCDCSINTSNICKEAVYIPCGNGANCQWDHSMSLTDFNIQISNDQLNQSYDSIIYSNSNNWPNITDTDTFKYSSYSLQYLGYNNQYGANYIRSCDMYGTPGASNRQCTENELKCKINTDCKASGDNGAYCNANSNYICVCNDVGFYYKQNSCYPIPKPSNCIAHIVKNGTQKYTKFVWKKAPIDSDIFYANTYYRTGLTAEKMVTVVDVSRIRNEDDLYEGVSDIAGYVFTRIIDENNDNKEYNSGKWITNCTINTQSPSPAPSMSPTISPTISPTFSPTAAPTWQIPKVFLSGEFCKNDRCHCSNQDFECCLETNSSDILYDDANLNCSQQQLKYIVGNDVFHSVKIFPETFPYATKIKWKISFNGTIGENINNINANASMENLLQINIIPMNGTSVINGSTSVNIKLDLNESDIICADNSTNCKSQLVGLTAVFLFEIIECYTLNKENMFDECEVIYPYDLVMYVTRDDIDSGIGGGHEDKIGTWVWIVLAACAAFLLLLSWLVYRYWYKGKKQDTDYKILADDVEVQKVQNDEDFETNLNNNKDVEFNPLATGMPGVDKNHDPLTAEVQQREMLQQNEMVEQDAYKEVFKEDMGQVQGKMSEHYQL